MDMQKNGSHVGQGVRRIPGKKMVVGSKQLRKALQNGLVAHVYLAQNADPAITEPLETLCHQYSVSCVWVPSMQELGKQCGIEVGTAAAAVLK